MAENPENHPENHLENHPENILIVDDRLENLRLLSKMLAGEGYKVRKLLDGFRALDAAQLAPPDLILLDIMMPGMDGYEVCQNLKADPRTQEIPVIFLSALDDIGDKVKAFAVGGVDYITKPFQQEEVLARVKTHLQLQKLTQTLKQQNAMLAAEVAQRKAAEDSLEKALIDLKTAQEQIIAREKLAALGALTAGIAHEIRNPLNFVNNYAESSVELMDELLLSLETKVKNFGEESFEGTKLLLADLRENAAAIFQHGQRAERIINNMMQHARMDNRSPQLSDINYLLEEAIELVIRGKRVQNLGFTIKIERDYDSEIGTVEVLSNETSRAFMNLIDNAFYALQKKKNEQTGDFSPTLLVKTRKQKSEVCIWIRDNGVGIPQECQSRLFDPFFTTKPAGEGTGLGLSMTYEIIVRQHQGSLRVVSEPGRYTEFILTFPISRA